MSKVKQFAGWAWFVAVQLIMFAFMLLGLVVLIWPCLARAWEPSPAPSVKDGRQIDRWKWRALAPFQNPEDGVSGQTALVMLNPVQTVPFMPGADDRWRAYVWSALRNSCDGLKYVFAWKGGPYTEFTVGSKRIRLGWVEENGVRVPVF